MKFSRVKNPNWPEANQLAIYIRSPGFELVNTKAYTKPTRSDDSAARIKEVI